MQVEYLREQKDQLTALENIYLEEFQIVKETAPYRFNVLCKPYKGNSMEYQINLMFEFTQKYPLTPLKFQIQPIAGVTRDNINHITQKIDEIISESEHRPIVFDIVEETRNWIHQFLVEGRSYQIEQTYVVKKEEVFERPKFAAFTPVNVENFLAWKKEFEAQFKVDKDKGKKEGEVKLSGKEWFLGKHEESQSQSQEQEDSDQEDEEEEEPERVQPENQLFQN